MSVSAANVAEVEYYQALINDQFKKLEALHKQQQSEIAAAGIGVGSPRSSLVNSSGEQDFERRWAKCLQRLHKSIDRLRNECEKLAITGMTAESAASLLERQKKRFGFSSKLSQAKTKSNPKQLADGKPDEETFTVSTRDPALAATEKWRWIAYEHEIDAVFANKYPVERVTALMWEASPVAQTLKSRMKTLLTELIPLERVLDDGKIRRTPPLSPERSGVGSSGPTTSSLSEGNDCDQAIVRLLMGSLRDALEQLRSTCRDAVTIKEASVVEARLKATTAVATALGSLSAAHIGASTSVSALSTPTFHVRVGSSCYATPSASVGGCGGAAVSPLLTPATAPSQAPTPPPLLSPSISLLPVGNTHFRNVHSSAALTPFEVSVVQFMAAEVVRIATCYSITLDGGNACSGTSALAASRAERSERERERDHRLALLVGAGGCPSYAAGSTCRSPTTATCNPICIGASSSTPPLHISSGGESGVVGESAEKGGNAGDGADLLEPNCAFDHDGEGGRVDGERGETCAATQEKTPRSSSSVHTAPAIFASAGLSDGGEGSRVQHNSNSCAKEEFSSVALNQTEPTPPLTVTPDGGGAPITCIAPSSSGTAPAGAKACALM